MARSTKTRETSVTPRALPVALNGLDLAEVLDSFRDDQVMSRLWKKDASLWKGDPVVQGTIRKRLGWLSLPEDMAAEAKDLTSFADKVRRAGFRDAVLLGMGGSSLCPEVLWRTFGTRKGFLRLHVLDTTDPGALAAVEKKIQLGRTLFIVSSKSGGTIEMNSLFAYFFARVAAVKKSRAGEQFVAVTDPGTSLEKLAKERRFRRVFTSPADVGGRFSALTYFGLVPAALLGIDLPSYLLRAQEAAEACAAEEPVETNVGAWLGAALGAAAEAKRDKVTFVLAPEIAAFGLWVEQLVAESTGKEGVGLVPVEGEALEAPAAYGKDRLFVSLALKGKHAASVESKLKALESAGHPVIRLELADRWDLAKQFFYWEVATALAGRAMGINPFDEPNVSESKANSTRILGQFLAEKALPEPAPDAREGNIALWAVGPAGKTASVAQGIARLLATVKRGDYIGLLAYVTPDAATCRALDALRRALRKKTGLPVTLGFGPRFLHSTGQLHKGGDNNGVFIQITGDDRSNPEIPGAGYGLSVLKRAQALGDIEALTEHKRRALRLHLARPAVDLARVTAWVSRARGSARG